MKNYLEWLSGETASAWWHDSADTEELQAAMKAGAVGVTTNPLLVSQVLKKKRDIISANADEIKAAKNSDERVPAIIKAVTVDLAKILLPIFKETEGENGYVCAQVNPYKAAYADSMIESAIKISGWAENITVKLPATRAGLEAAEECVARGINVTVTVSFTVPQVLAVMERFEKGYARAEKAGKTPRMCNAVLMVGRLDDYLRDVARDRGANISEEDIICAGTAAIKRAYGIFRERGHNKALKLLPAGMRGAYHAVDLSGAAMRMSIHPKIQKMILEAGAERRERIGEPIDKAVLGRLMALDEFVRAYEPDGMKEQDFITYGVTQKTLTSFMDAWDVIAAFEL